MTDTFWLSRNKVHMLILHPQFPLPKTAEARACCNRTEIVSVVRPDGQQIEATAQFAITHLNVSGPAVSLDERWPVTIWLTDRTLDEVPAGSKIFASKEIRAALISADHA